MRRAGIVALALLACALLGLSLNGKKGRDLRPTTPFVVSWTVYDAAFGATDYLSPCLPGSRQVGQPIAAHDGMCFVPRDLRLTGFAAIVTATMDAADERCEYKLASLASGTAAWSAIWISDDEAPSGCEYMLDSTGDGKLSVAGEGCTQVDATGLLISAGDAWYVDPGGANCTQTTAVRFYAWGVLE